MSPQTITPTLADVHVRLANVSTSTLWSVVKRGKYQRYGVFVARVLQNELAIRRMQERRVS